MKKPSNHSDIENATKETDRYSLLLEQCKLFEKLLTVMIMEGDSCADLERDNLRAILDRVEGETE